MARSLTKLLAHDCEFVWTNQCDISFQMLKDTLCSAPILMYPDTSKLYMLYTNASTYGWAGVVSQRHTSTVDGKEVTMDHPILHVSSLFCGSQLNQAMLMKESYAIYMSIKKSTFYLTGHEITLRSDHLPLKKFLRKLTLINKYLNVFLVLYINFFPQSRKFMQIHEHYILLFSGPYLHHSNVFIKIHVYFFKTVNNWSTEIEGFSINFVHISGKANISADTLSRLIDTDPDLKQQLELEGHEFGKYCFETLPKVRGSVSHEKVGVMKPRCVKYRSHMTILKIWNCQLNYH